MIDISDKSVRICISTCTSPVDFIDFRFWNIQHFFRPMPVPNNPHYHHHSTSPPKTDVRFFEDFHMKTARTCSFSTHVECLFLDFSLTRWRGRRRKKKRAICRPSPWKEYQVRLMSFGVLLCLPFPIIYSQEVMQEEEEEEEEKTPSTQPKASRKGETSSHWWTLWARTSKWRKEERRKWHA